MAGPPPAGGSLLDRMPPSPASVGSNPGASPSLTNGNEPIGGPAMSAMGAPLQIGSDQLPPEILQGVMAVGQNVTEMIGSLAQITPDLAQDWEAIKQLILATLAKLLTQGAPPPSPTAPGSAFPGVVGGMDRGRPF